MTSYTKELTKILEKRSVVELEFFLEEQVKKGTIDKQHYNKFRETDYLFQLGTMCKMICNLITTSEETKEWARERLKEIGWKEEIWGNKNAVSNNGN